MLGAKLQSILNSEIENRVLSSTFEQAKVSKKELSAEDKIKAKEAAKGFESLFMYLVLKEMRKAMLENFQNEEQRIDFGGDILGDLGYMELTNQLAKSGSGIGIANLIYKHLTGENLENRVENQNLKEANSRSMNLHKPISFSKSSVSPLNREINSFSKPDKLSIYEEYITEAAKKYQLKPELIKSVILAESNANRYAISKAGAKGLMQLLDSTANYLGIDNAFEPKQNILGGSRYLRQLLDTFEGNLDLALAAYNAGPGNVYKYGGIPPFPETRAYVARVKKIYERISSNKDLGY